MKRLLKLSLIASILVFALSSCLTIEEQYTLKKNGSGTAKTLIDMSEMKSLLAMAMEESEEGNPMEEMSFQEIKEQLSGMKGISNVKVVENKEDYIFSWQYDFESIEALNNARSAMDESGATRGLTQTGSNVFSNSFSMPSGLPMDDLLGGDDGETEAAAMMLGQMKYRIILNTQKPVQAVYAGESANIEYEGSGKSVVISSNFSQIMANPDILSWTIVTK
ncbi:MAG: hypothetical protein R3B47_03030 [Bacteroidia bacterium]